MIQSRFNRDSIEAIVAAEGDIKGMKSTVILEKGQEFGVALDDKRD